MDRDEQSAPWIPLSPDEFATYTSDPSNFLSHLPKGVADSVSKSNLDLKKMQMGDLFHWDCRFSDMLITAGLEA